jgi:hypothetical protein
MRGALQDPLEHLLGVPWIIPMGPRGRSTGWTPERNDASNRPLQRRTATEIGTEIWDVVAAKSDPGPANQLLAHSERTTNLIKTLSPIHNGPTLSPKRAHCKSTASPQRCHNQPTHNQPTPIQQKTHREPAPHPQQAYNEPIASPQRAHSEPTASPQRAHSGRTATPQQGRSVAATRPQQAHSELTSSPRRAQSKPVARPQGTHKDPTAIPQRAHNKPTTSPQTTNGAAEAEAEEELPHKPSSTDIQHRTTHAHYDAREKRNDFLGRRFKKTHTTYPK